MGSVLLSVSAGISAYDVSTHGVITYQAYLRSELVKAEMLQDREWMLIRC